MVFVELFGKLTTAMASGAGKGSYISLRPLDTGATKSASA